MHGSILSHKNFWPANKSFSLISWKKTLSVRPRHAYCWMSPPRDLLYLGPPDRHYTKSEIHGIPCIKGETVSYISHYAAIHFVKLMQHDGFPLFNPPSIQHEKKLTSRKLLVPNSLEKSSHFVPLGPTSSSKSLPYAKQKHTDESLKHIRHTWWPIQPH